MNGPTGVADCSSHFAQPRRPFLIKRSVGMYSAQKGVLGLLDDPNRERKRGIEKIEFLNSRGTSPLRLCGDRYAVGKHRIGGRYLTVTFSDY
jgi:hypothetical protein